jgi:hypothetical protein
MISWLIGVLESFKARAQRMFSALNTSSHAKVQTDIKEYHPKVSK